jgi:enoyl-CoA hydratase/carnithine racemase
MPLIRLESDGARSTLVLDDPARRNAMGEAMFAAFGTALATVEARAAAQPPHRTDVLVLRGEGAAFCAGFDLGACAERPALLATFVHALGDAVRRLRALPCPVVAQVQGAALAGGCALLAACDFVVVAPDAQLGYPVHRIGVSPAVTLPALLANAGAGRARQVTMGGAIVDGAGAVAQGLATQCAASGGSLAAEVDALAARLLAKGPDALRATKRWLNELDGTGDPARFAHAAAASAAAAEGDEFASMLREFWSRQRR